MWFRTAHSLFRAPLTSLPGGVSAILGTGLGEKAARRVVVASKQGPNYSYIYQRSTAARQTPRDSGAICSIIPCCEQFNRDGTWDTTDTSVN